MRSPGGYSTGKCYRRNTPRPPGRLPEEGTLASSGSRRALAGFFVSGLLISFLGAILPSWQHHLSSEYETVGFYFSSD